MSFQLAEPVGVAVPRTIEKTLAAGYAALEGALLLVNASDEFAECGADPAAIAAVAISAGGTDTSGFIRFAKKEFPPGKMQGMAWLADYRYSARYVGSLPGANGGSYGVVRDTDTYWKVDFAETVNTRLKLVGRRTASPENIARVVVAPLAANVQVI